MQDLWVMAPSDLQARAVATSGDMPSPRVGHAALLIGNAFIGEMYLTNPQNLLT